MADTPSRVAMVTDLLARAGITTRDGLISNGLVEIQGDGTFAIKRGGLTQIGTGFGAGTGIGQGIIPNPANPAGGLLIVSGGTLWSAISSLSWVGVDNPEDFRVILPLNGFVYV